MPLSSFRLRKSPGVPVLAFLVAVAFLQPPAAAQGAPNRTGRADPLDPQARVPAVTHASPLASYRRLGDDGRVAWRQANDTVNRIGGWRAYAREARQPDPAASAPAGPDSAAPAHGGHKRP